MRSCGRILVLLYRAFSLKCFGFGKIVISFFSELICLLSWKSALDLYKINMNFQMVQNVLCVVEFDLVIL